LGYAVFSISGNRFPKLELTLIETMGSNLIGAPALGKPEGLSIQDFRGDFDNVAKLIQESWAENNQQHLLYSSNFLASCFEYPGCSFSLAPTLYDGSKPIAFIAGFPRRLRFKGRELRVILCTFLAVSNEHKRAGYGVILWNELVKRAQAAGFDGMVNYCVDGEPMNGMILGCCRALKLPTERIFSVLYQMRLLQPKPAPQLEFKTESGCVGALLQTAALVSDQAPLARIWSEKEAEWQCRRHDAVVARHVSGPRQGLLTAYVMEIANPQRTKCLLIEDVLWGTLEQEERLALVRKLLVQAVAAGAQMAIVPCLGYADMEPFGAARFRRTPRVLHAYLTVFKGEPPPEAVSSMYLDVF
jgi:Acetyltransferase (GNAT) family